MNSPVTSGHLFVLHGKIGSVVSDVDIISTDAAFNVERHWWPVLGVDGQGRSTRTQLQQMAPLDWADRGFGRSRSSDRTWFINVGSASFHLVADRLNLLLDSIAQQDLRTRAGRVLPLITVPLLGVGAGGHGGRRGDVINRQLEVCEQFVVEHAIDVAIVSPTRAAYGALQHQRRARSTDRPYSDEAMRLGDLARQDALALFIGAGASVPSGLPSWKELLTGLLDNARSRGAKDVLTPEEAQSFERLDALDQAQLLQQVLGDSLPTDVANLIVPPGTTRTPALAHVLLAALDCHAAVTTNYDCLYEDAVRATGQPGQEGRPLTVVLPEQLPSANQRWLLKMHGSITRPKTIVLTRSQFAGFDAAAGPSGAVLQSLLLTKHLLVIGTSMSDPNVLRLIDGVERYRQVHTKDETQRRLGTVVDVDGEPARRRLHSGSFDWISMAGVAIADRARQIEVLLDQVAMYASSDMTWLLDPRFADLHDSPATGEIAMRLRDVAQQLESLPLGPAWSRVRDNLAAWGGC